MKRRGRLYRKAVFPERARRTREGASGAGGAAAAVAVHIGRIRETLEDDPASPKLLQTVWGVGYRLRTDAV